MASKRGSLLYSFKMLTRDLWLDTDSERLDEFTKLKTNGEKIRLALDLGCEALFQDIVVDFKEKSGTLSTAARQRGNELFKAKRYEEALISYNSGIILAPVAAGTASAAAAAAAAAVGQSGTSDGDGTTAAAAGPELAFGFANRSAALYSLERYDQSLVDIEHALSFGYPRNLQYKLYERRGKCLLGKRRVEDARAAFQKAWEMSQEASLEDQARQRWEKAMKIHMKNCNEMSPSSEPPVSRTDKLPELDAERSETFPCASKAFGMQKSQTQGRHVVAEQDVKVGDVIAVEKPYAAVVYPEHYLEYCQHCFKPAFTPYPCMHCSRVVYCCQACHDDSWEKYHRIECRVLGYLSKEWVGRLGHLALRVAQTAGWSAIRQLYSGQDGDEDEEPASSADKQPGFDQDGLYLDTYASIQHLVTHSNDADAESAFYLSLMAVFLGTILMKTDFCPSLSENEREVEEESSTLLTLATALLHHLQIVQCNGYAVAEMDNQHSDLRMCQPRDLGLAIYPTVSLFNHSCDPVVDFNFHGNVCVVRAIRNVKEGEELNGDYGPLFFIQPKEERQETLLTHYFFRCSCVACTQNWPQWEGLETKNVSFLCGKCGKRLEGPTNAKKRAIKCKHCGRLQNVESCLDLLAKSHTKYAQAMDQAMSGEIESSLPAIKNHLTLMQRLLCQPWRDFYTCQATIKQCYRVMANRQQTRKKS